MKTEEFITKAKHVHGDRYDYSKVNYINCKTKVVIICKKHGVFKMRPEHHTDRGQGCPVCKESIGERIINNYLEKKMFRI